MTSWKWKCCFPPLVQVGKYSAVAKIMRSVCLWSASALSVFRGNWHGHFSLLTATGPHSSRLPVSTHAGIFPEVALAFRVAQPVDQDP